MSDLFQRDQRLRPDLFIWNGPLSEGLLSRWLRDHGLAVNKELFELWRDTGGGEMFESELVLAPFSDRRSDEEVIAVNASHWTRGLPRDLLLVHI